MTKNKRPDEAYEIEALSKGLMVLEALEGIRFEPVSVQVVMQRTGLPRDTVDRSLKTLRLKGYAICENGKWEIGRRFFRFVISVNYHRRFLT